MKLQKEFSQVGRSDGRGMSLESNVFWGAQNRYILEQFENVTQNIQYATALK